MSLSVDIGHVLSDLPQHAHHPAHGPSRQRRRARRAEAAAAAKAVENEHNTATEKLMNLLQANLLPRIKYKLMMLNKHLLTKHCGIDWGIFFRISFLINFF